MVKNNLVDTEMTFIPPFLFSSLGIIENYDRLS